MGKQGISRKQKKSSKEKSSLKNFDIFHKRLANKKVVRDILLEAMKDGDLGTFREVLSSHLKTVSKLNLAKETGIGRQTLYDLIDESKDFDPKLSTVSAILKNLAA